MVLKGFIFMPNKSSKIIALFAEKVLLADGWASNKTLIIENGLISAIKSGDIDGAEKAQGVVIPGMINCHSHAFQRAFAGACEQGSEGKDSFWTWRTVMYKCLSRLSVEHLESIANQLYIEMLKMGYTRVAEFHYLHHDESGAPYSELAAMSAALFKAAQNAGIGLTLLPVLYRFSGFGEQPPLAGQKRFINSVEQFNALVSECWQLSKTYPNTNVGIAPHSLRAVDKPALLSAINHVRALDKKAPIHIHIAEQQQEVDDCFALYQQRPVQWLLENLPLDEHGCLIHATHINENERQGIIASKATVGICPTTEANLGDGIFPTAEFLSEQGTFAIGSDSHISVNPIEELRWLEYAQRLIKQQRAVLASATQKSVGENLWVQAAKGGAQSTNSNTGELAVGKQADLLVLSKNHMQSFAHSDQQILDSVIFASQQSPIKDVMVNGEWVIKEQQHQHELAVSELFANTLSSLAIS